MRIKVTLKDGQSFDADSSKSEYYKYFGAKIEPIYTPLEFPADEKIIINRPKGNKKT